MKVEVSIFTPTYNRAPTLRRCYESILDQGYLEKIEWVVINDGSNDHTDEIIKEIISENKIKLVYVRQGNQGKQASWNKALGLAQGKYFVGLDSDDALSSLSLFRIIESNLSLLEEEDVIGIRCLAINTLTQKPSARSISNCNLKLSWFDEFSSKNNLGERIDILKTEIIRSFPYPIEKNIKFIPEVWFYANISRAGYNFIYTPEVLRLFFDNDTTNRLSRTNVFKHAKGHYIARSAMLNLIPFGTWLRNPISFIKAIIRFSQMANYLEISFDNRVKKTNYFYAFISYLFFPLSFK